MVRVKHSRIPKIATVCACLGTVLVIAVWASARIFNSHILFTQEIRPNIVNKTSALEVLSATPILMGQEHVFQVKLRNVSTKNIVSYSYLVGHAAITNSYAFSEKLLGPGETSEENIPYENLQVAAASSVEPDPALVFAAVWFEGGTGDGDPKVIKRLRDESEGLKEQAGRILPLLRKALRDSEVEDDRVLTDLESEISRLPTEDESANHSIDYSKGRSAANRQLALKVKQLRENKSGTAGLNRKAEVIGYLTSWEHQLMRF